MTLIVDNIKNAARSPARSAPLRVEVGPPNNRFTAPTVGEKRRDDGRREAIAGFGDKEEIEI